jgi:hypothetical protein
MNTPISDEAADQILRGNKVGALAAIRRELECSLQEAIRIADEFDQDLGTLRGKIKEPARTIETSYHVPWMFHIIFLAVSKNLWRIPKSLKLAKKYRINVNYYILRTHATAGGNPYLVIKEMCNAIKEGFQPDLMKLMAADITFMSEEKFKSWVKNGMSEPIGDANSGSAPLRSAPPE